jgi:hypothetical protein
LSGNAISCKLLAGANSLSKKHLIEAIAKRYWELPQTKRVADVRSFVARSAEDKRFFRRYFRELFDEAFPSLKTSARAGTPVTLMKPVKPVRGANPKTWKRKSHDS